MKKVTPGKALTTMIDTIIAKAPEMTQARIAEEIGCDNTYISKLKTKERNGESVPAVFLRKIEKRFEYILTGNIQPTTTVYVKDTETGFQQLMEQHITLEAKVDVFMREFVEMLADSKGITPIAMEERLTRSSKALARQRIALALS